MRFLLFLVFLSLSLFSRAQVISADTGYCSFYGNEFHGRRTASGEKYNRYDYTAAHRTLPFQTFVEVTNLSNNKSVVVRITDRGPHIKNRIIDISRAAAEDIGMVAHGVTRVAVRVTTEPPPPPRQMEKPLSKSSSTNNSLLKKGKITDADLNEITVKGYGIQAGYYKNLQYCVSALRQYENKYSCKGYILVVLKGNIQHYRLILGSFNTREEAGGLLFRVEKDIKGCFVVEWDKL